MKSRHTCHNCEFVEKWYVSEKFKMSADCMQPVDPDKERNRFFPSGEMVKNEDISFFQKSGSLRESTSFPTTSGVAFFLPFLVYICHLSMPLSWE